MVLLLLAAAGSLLSPSARAEDPPKQDARYPEGVTRAAAVRIDDATVTYRVTASIMPLKDDAGKTKANIFYTAYTREFGEGERHTLPRPITFAFNGGPGSSSVWLHMGTIGPRRVVYGDEGEMLPPPGRIGNNAESWLDFTDVVFIDPVTTGYSRPVEGENASQFHGLSEDIRAVAEFIRMYISRENRWLSPKFLAGESYGTTRAAGLANALQGDGINLSGIVLISPVLQFQTIRFDAGNDTPYWLFLPTYTAAAWHHKKLAPELQELELPELLRQARVFASSEYLVALAKGRAIPEAEKSEMAAKVARLTGVSASFVERADLRLRMDQFAKELLRDSQRTIGRFDARYTGLDKDQNNDTYEYDPSYAVLQGPFTAALNAYLGGELGYKTDLKYEILTGRVQPWSFGGENRYAETADALRQAMTTNPFLKVLVSCGYYDMATPFFAAEFTVDHMDLDASRRANVGFSYYRSGHMMYLRTEDRAQLRRDVKAMYDAALRPRAGEPLGR